MSDLKKYLDKQLTNPAFAEEYERQRPEYEALHARIALQVNRKPVQNCTLESSTTK